MATRRIKYQIPDTFLPDWIDGGGGKISDVDVALGSVPAVGVVLGLGARAGVAGARIVPRSVVLARRGAPHFTPRAAAAAPAAAAASKTVLPRAAGYAAAATVPVVGAGVAYNLAKGPGITEGVNDALENTTRGVEELLASLGGGFHDLSAGVGSGIDKVGLGFAGLGLGTGRGVENVGEGIRELGAGVEKAGTGLGVGLGALGVAAALAAALFLAVNLRDDKKENRA